MIRRYQDISHLRAPYKDSYLSGLGELLTFPTVMGADQIPRLGKDQRDQYALGMIGMMVDMTNARPLQAEDVLELPLYAAADVVAMGQKDPASIEKMIPFAAFNLDEIPKIVGQGATVFGPVSFDTAKSGQKLVLVRGANFIKTMAQGGDSLIIAEPVPEKKTMSMAAMAGWGAVALLVMVGISSMSKGKRRR